MDTIISIRHTTPQAAAWLRKVSTARVLHVFDNSCNLINGAGQVVSLVNPTIDRGPFNLVLAVPVEFTANLDAESAVSYSETALRVGNLRFDHTTASPWNPRPTWQTVSTAARETLARTLEAWPQRPGVQPQHVPEDDDPAALNSFAITMAGRGPGLTPSGDDFLVGWMHAAWCRMRPEDAAQTCRPVAEAAALRTTSLSAAWLRAAADGYAGEPWHRLLDAVAGRDESFIRRHAESILQTGHTSGADALSGFITGLRMLDESPVTSTHFTIQSTGNTLPGEKPE